jgi:hypothetical protein
MDNKYLYVILTIIILYVLYINFNKKENFTESENLFSQKLLELFKQDQTPSFLAYLEILNKIGNTYDNLISKGVYNKFIKKGVNIKIDDILEEMK